MILVRRFNQWYQRHTSDTYVKQAKKHGYRARSAFKLIELQQRYKFISKGMRVLELGAHPGAWTQVLIDLTKSSADNPLITGVDLCDIEPLPGAKFLSLDVSVENAADKILEFAPYKYDAVMSDLAPNFSGDRDFDCIMTVDLNIKALRLSRKLLKPGGIVIMKILSGFDEPEHYNRIKNFFKDIQRVKPTASRSMSREFYYLCQGWKPDYLEEINEESVRKLAESVYALGETIDPEIEKIIEKEVGTVQKGINIADDPRLSFNQPNPKNFEELEAIVKMQQSGELERIIDNEINFDEEEDSEDEDLEELFGTGFDEGSEEHEEEDENQEKEEGYITELKRNFEHSMERNTTEDYREAAEDYERIKRMKPGKKLYTKKEAMSNLNQWTKAYKESKVWKK